MTVQDLLDLIQDLPRDTPVVTLDTEYLPGSGPLLRESWHVVDGHLVLLTNDHVWDEDVEGLWNQWLKSGKTGWAE